MPEFTTAPGEAGPDAPAPRRADPWRFLDPAQAQDMATRIAAQPPPPPIPWTPIAKPLSRARIALLSTAGLSMKGDRPFDLETERRRPSWGDPTFRRIRADASAADVEVSHLHINASFIQRDLNVALPLDRLRELVGEGIVGSMAETHYSTMGYQGASTRVLENETAPAIAAAMKSEEVDCALLAPV